MCCEGWWLARRRRCCPMTTLNCSIRCGRRGNCVASSWMFTGKPKTRPRSRSNPDGAFPAISGARHLPVPAERGAATRLLRRRSSTKPSELSLARVTRSSNPNGISRSRVPTRRGGGHRRRAAHPADRGRPHGPQIPTPHQRSVLEAIAAMSAQVVVMSEAASQRLCLGFDVDPRKVSTIWHGARLRQVAPPARSDGPRLVTWGLLGPGRASSG